MLAGVLRDGLTWTASFIVTWWIWGVVHEFFHVLAALAVGCGRQALEASNVHRILVDRCVVVQGASKEQASVIRHAGWIGSTALAVLVCSSSASAETILGCMDELPPRSTAPATLALAIVAIEACLSDLFGLEISVSRPNLGQAFHCGNFGVIIAGHKNREHVFEILRKMVEVTMM